MFLPETSFRISPGHPPLPGATPIFFSQPVLVRRRSSVKLFFSFTFLQAEKLDLLILKSEPLGMAKHLSLLAPGKWLVSAP